MKVFELTTGDDGFDELIEASELDVAKRQVLRKHNLKDLPPHWELEELELDDDDE